MPNIRITLWAVLGAILFLNYTTWMQDYAPRPTAQNNSAASQPAGAPANTLGDSVPQAASSAASSAPQAASPASTSAASSQASPPAAAASLPTSDAPVGTPL